MSKPIDDGGPAFPVVEFDVAGGHWDGRYEVKQQHAGLSLRDWFAGQALAGFMAQGADENHGIVDIAWDCYRIADAMLAERSRDRE